MKISEYQFEGTPEEFLRVANALRGKGPQDHLGGGQPEADYVAVSGREFGNKRFVTKDEAVHIMRRRKLSTHLDRFLRELYNAGDQRVKSEHLQSVLGFKGKRGADQFRGLMGAFGRRVKHDVGPDVGFFDDNWNADAGQKEWRLPASVRQAIEQLGWYR